MLTDSLATNSFKPFGPLRETEEVGNEVFERSAAVDEALRYMTYLYLQRADRELTNN